MSLNPDINFQGATIEFEDNQIKNIITNIKECKGTLMVNLVACLVFILTYFKVKKQFEF